MRQCIDISAVSLAERLGGPQGYQLLLAAVKSLWPFRLSMEQVLMGLTVFS